jgi:hypothetical protein
MVFFDKLKFWISVRQEMKREIFKTNEFDVLIEVKIMNRK